MPLKTVSRLIAADALPMGSGLVTYQPIPHAGLPHLDPFLLLHHTGPVAVPPGGPGLPFGPHPHRGFETATFIFAGDMHHHDSHGHRNTTYPGGAQWMTAGRGIVHSEGLSKDLQAEGGEIEYIQLWVNLPARLKLVQPRYQGVDAAQVPRVDSPDGLGHARVFAGPFGGVQGPVESITGIHAATLALQAGGELRLEVSDDRTVLLYVLHGQATVNGREVGGRTLVEFAPGGTEIRVQAALKTHLLYCTGRPFNEPLVAHGPFVMNSQAEILEAVRDYQLGKMGVLVDE